MAEVNKTTTGLPRNTAAALSYLAGWVTGLIMLVVEKDKFVRFHAMQSILVFGGINLIVMVPIFGWLLAPFLAIIGLILWLVLMWKAYQGEEVLLPVVGEWAKQQAAKMS